MTLNMVEEMTENVSDVVGLKTSEVTYPLLISLYGETKRGKTYFGANFPHAVVFDFPPVKMGFKECFVDTSRTVGEGFRSLFSPINKDGSIIWRPKIPNFDYKNQYKFIKSWDDFQTAIELTKFYSETLPTTDGRVWVIIDDTNRWRGVEIVTWQKKNSGKWPAPVQFGQITQSMQAAITDIQEFANVLLISRMVKNFDTGEYGPQVYPSGSDYLADASLEITNTIKNDKVTQIVKIHSNGHDFACNPTYCTEVSGNPLPIDVLNALKIPRELW